MTYERAMKFIASTYKFGSKLGLRRISSLLKHMGDPQKKLKYVHVAGTNGKGSTVAFISNILINAGYTTGTYISPFIHRFNERITVNGIEIPDEDIGRIADSIRKGVERMLELGDDAPTEFEVVTAMAFQYYYERDCDLVVLETGLGGRLDSTNIIDTAEVSVITTIDYDHTKILGETLAEIAFEKSGIIKPYGRVVMYPQQPEAEEVIRRVCREKDAELIPLSIGQVVLGDYNLDGQSFSFAEYERIKLSMLPEFQCYNATVAIIAARILNDRGYYISEMHIRDGLFGTHWFGRFEIMQTDPVFIIDGAHNKQGAEHLAINLRRYFSQKITFIVGVSSDKDYMSMIEEISPLAKRFIATQADGPRALSAAKLAAYLKAAYSEVDVSIVCNPEAAVRAALELCGRGEVICSFGSLFHAGVVREFFMPVTSEVT